MQFKDLNLHKDLLAVVEKSGFTVPTPIQQEAIPIILNGSDIRASAQTGTGKTAAYILPSINLLITKPSTPHRTGPRVLILVPTRELAMQVAQEATRFSPARIKTVCIYGGAPYPVQYRQLSRPYDILVATPGRLIDHLLRGRVNLSKLDMLILDEADRMLDMGFIQPVEKIAEATPASRQTLLFSATLKGSVLNLSKNLLKSPIEISIVPEATKIENIEQRLHYVDNLHHKNLILSHLLTDTTINQAIIFTSTKRHADQLARELFDEGHDAAALHGDMNQRERSRTLHRLREGQIRFLVATDVAARGIDVRSITHVINFDLPNSIEDYVHRIGRTGRAGDFGVALSLAAHKEVHLVRQIERFTGKKINTQVIAGLEPTGRSPQKPFRSNNPPSRSRFKSPRLGK